MKAAGAAKVRSRRAPGAPATTPKPKRAGAAPVTKRPGRAATAVGASDPAAVVAALKAILLPYAKHLVLVSDGPAGCYLDTRRIGPNRKPIFFGAVRAGKSYVSYHLMPVYACPDLLKGLSPALAARMQGKACFNFRSVDAPLFRELAALTKRGFERFRDGDFVGGPKYAATKG
jgi:hypothetical protein